MKHLNDFEVHAALILADAEISQTEIVKTLHCSQSTVSRILSQHDITTFDGRKNTGGRPRKTTKDEDKHLIDVVQKHHTLPFRDITNISGLNISPKTTCYNYDQGDPALL